MDDLRFFKTEAGRQEIAQRTRKLATGLRSILLMVDGRRSEAELAELIGVLHAPSDALAQLAAEGLIAMRADAGEAGPVPGGTGMTAAERYIALYTLLSDGIRVHLGLKGYFLQLKVERCADADALQALLPEMATALAKARDHAFATRWLDGVRASVVAPAG